MYLLSKSTVCGDLLSSSNNVIKSALTKLSKSKVMTQEESMKILGIDMHIPDPVFFCSIEPPSQVNYYYLFFIYCFKMFNFKLEYIFKNI